MDGVECPDGKRPNDKKRLKRSTSNGPSTSDTATPTNVEIRGAGHAERLPTLASSTAAIFKADDTTQSAGTKTIPDPSATCATSEDTASNGCTVRSSTNTAQDLLLKYTSEAGSLHELTPKSYKLGPDFWPSGIKDWSPELTNSMNTNQLMEIQQLRRQRHIAMIEKRGETIASLTKRLYELTGKPGYA